MRLARFWRLTSNEPLSWAAKKAPSQISCPTRNLSRRWSYCRFARLIRIDVVALLVCVLLHIGDGGGRRNDTALGRDARLGLSALDNFCTYMRELGRFKHCVQVGATAGISERSERDDDHCNGGHDRHVAMPAGAVPPPPPPPPFFFFSPPPPPPGGGGGGGGGGGAD